MSDLKQHLFDRNPLNTFALIDGAATTGLLDKIYQFRPKHVCLLRGKLTPDMAEVAPYLISLDKDSGFTEWLSKQALNKHWGIFLRSKLNEKKLRRKFREMMNAQLPDGRKVMFRFYDPRIMNVYLPSCNAQELDVVFQDVYEYIVEDVESEKLVRYRTLNGVLFNEELH